MDPKNLVEPKPIDLTGSGTTLLLWLGGALALAFVLFLLWDVVRGWQREREFRRRTEASRQPDSGE